MCLAHGPWLSKPLSDTQMLMLPFCVPSQLVQCFAGVGTQCLLIESVSQWDPHKWGEHWDQRDEPIFGRTRWQASDK